jgi:hypothetical protein
MIFLEAIPEPSQKMVALVLDPQMALQNDGV